MLCAAQWQKSPGVFMRKKDKEFTIEDGTAIYQLKDNSDSVLLSSKGQLGGSMQHV